MCACEFYISIYVIYWYFLKKEVSLSVSLLLLLHNVYFCKVRKSSVVNTEQRVPVYFTLTLQNSSCPQNCRPMAVFKASRSGEDQRDIPTGHTDVGLAVCTAVGLPRTAEPATVWGRDGRLAQMAWRCTGGWREWAGNGNRRAGTNISSIWTRHWRTATGR